MNHETAQELLADFALDLLEPSEAAQVRAHVAECDECRDDLQPFLQATEALVLAPEPVDLPEGAAERIAAGVRQRIQAQAVAPVAPASNIVVGPWRMMALGAAAAVLLLAVGLTVVSIAWLDARDDAERLENVLAGGLVLPLSGEGASGTIYVASDFKSGLVRFDGLAEAPDQHHYQIWSEGPDGARSAADFTGGDGVLLVRLPALPKEMTRMFVTIEPDGASGALPTGPEVLSTPR